MVNSLNGVSGHMACILTYKYSDYCSDPITIRIDAISHSDHSAAISPSQVKMDCPQCSSRLDGLVHLPRILTGCGHTVCQLCLHNLSRSNFIRCPQCREPSTGTVESFPVNLALLSLQGSSEVCPSHKKLLEAYCPADKQLLCVTCLLSDEHKKHEVVAVAKAASKERDRVQRLLSSVRQAEQNLIKTDTELRTIAENVQQDFARIREDLKRTYDQVKALIIDREVHTLTGLKSTLETEMNALAQRSTQTQKALSLLTALKNDMSRAPQETDLQLLHKAADRDTAFKAINSKAGAGNCKGFGGVSREGELEALCRDIKALGGKSQQPNSAPLQIGSGKKQQPPLALANVLFSRDLRKSTPKPGPWKLDNSEAELSISRTMKVAPHSSPHSPSSAMRPDSRHGISHSQTPAPDPTKNWSEVEKGHLSIDISPVDSPPKGFIYVIGGFSDKGLMSVERFDCSKETWDFVSNSLSNRTQFGAVAFEDHIIALGGKTVSSRQAGKRVTSSEEYQISSNQWVAGSVGLPTARSGFACLILNSTLFVLGGTDGVPLKRAEMWDGSGWELLPHMRQRRDELAAVVGADQRIYAIGGFGGPDM